MIIKGTDMKHIFVIISVVIGSMSFGDLQAQGLEKTSDFGGQGLMIYDDTLFVGSREGLMFYALKAEKEWKHYGSDELSVAEFVKDGKHILAVIPSTDELASSLMLSTDGCNTYTDLMGQLTIAGHKENKPYTCVLNIVQDPGDRKHVYAAVSRSNKSYAADLLESRDFGQTWAMVGCCWKQLEDNWYSSIPGSCGVSINPYHPEYGYIYGKMTGIDVNLNYLLRTTDGFQSIIEEENNNIRIDNYSSKRYPIGLSMAFSPSDSNIALMYTCCGILRTVNGGETWNLCLQFLNEDHYEWAHQGQLIFDREHPEMVYCFMSRILLEPHETVFYFSDDEGLTWRESYVNDLETPLSICYPYNYGSYNQPFMALYEGSLFFSTYNGVYRIETDMLKSGLSNVKRGANSKESVFDLQGRRVTDAAQKGMFIVNGKKVVKN